MASDPITRSPGRDCRARRSGRVRVLGWAVGLVAFLIKTRWLSASSPWRRSWCSAGPGVRDHPSTLRWHEPGLTPVLERLQHEHVVIHELLDALDRALVALVSGSMPAIKLRSRPDTVSDARPSHLAYEETHLLEPFARSYCWPGCGDEATNHRVVDGLGDVIGESAAEHEPEVQRTDGH